MGTFQRKALLVLGAILILCMVASLAVLFANTPSSPDATLRALPAFMREPTLLGPAEPPSSGRVPESRAAGTEAAGASDQSIEGPSSANDLTVLVVDELGNPVPRAFAEFFSSGRVLNVDAGRVTARSYRRYEGCIEVWGATDERGVSLPLGPTSIEWHGAEAGSPVVRLAPGRSIRGSVVDEDGQPVVGVLVAAVPSAHPLDWRAAGFGASHYRGRLRDGRGGVDTTGEDGRFEIEGLGDATYHVHPLPREEWIVPTPVVLDAPATDVRFVSRRGIVADVTILDPEDRPVSGAEVIAERLRADGTTVPWAHSIAASDSQGVARLEGLDPRAEYRLLVDVNPQSRNLFPRQVEAWQPGTTTIRLERALAVRGVVRDDRGQPVMEGSVQYWREGLDAVVHTGREGTFTISGLRSGVIWLRAWTGEFREDRCSPHVAVDVGSHDVVLTVPGLSLEVVVDELESTEDRSSHAYLDLYAEQGGGYASRGHTWISETPRVVFRGLSSDESYTLWIHDPRDGWYVLKTGLRAGGVIHVRPTAGKTISGVVIGPPTGRNGTPYVAASRPGFFTAYSAAVGPGVVDFGPGRFEIRGLPDGEYTVSAHARDALGAWWRAETKAAAGGSTRLELREETSVR
jgi:hypothetical protein